MSKTYLPININDSVKIKLNEAGYKHMVKYHKAIALFENTKDRYNIEYFKAKANKEGYTEFQLWDFMQIFGSHTCMGMDLLFDAYILFEYKF